MELGQNFSAKLEPFLLMAKSAKGAAAAKLVQDATAAHGVFVFSELLEMPNVQEVCCCLFRGLQPLEPLTLTMNRFLIGV
jgi:COP9 signalosome complex subunit 7